MSLFKGYYETFNVYLPIDNDTTKRASFDYENADFQIDLNIIRINDLDAIVEAQELGEYRANAEGTNASQIIQSAVLKKASDETEAYQVVNKPRYNKSFKRYKLNLKPVNSVS